MTARCHACRQQFDAPEPPPALCPGCAGLQTELMKYEAERMRSLRVVAVVILAMLIVAGLMAWLT